ncbi:hypothetical protein XENORESO_009561 [Xenotaenia resolanae]|uniref:Uncharacterized protein n=1 Tax=Xenotaenia resolanae TaxID=208358 RepID=A0ABV0X0L5_9TELE
MKGLDHNKALCFLSHVLIEAGQSLGLLVAGVNMNKGRMSHRQLHLSAGAVIKGTGSGLVLLKATEKMGDVHTGDGLHSAGRHVDLSPEHVTHVICRDQPKCFQLALLSTTDLFAGFQQRFTWTTHINL